MQTLGCVSVDEYIRILSQKPEIEAQCRMHLTVSISRFFRDKRLWGSLENKFLPQVISENDMLFRVWSCGCARGEEAYSFKIVWDRLQHSYPSLPLLDLWATDINPVTVEMAEKRIFGVSSLKELPRNFIYRYFDQVSGKQLYILKPFLTEGITFGLHDIIKDPLPDSIFDFIFIRNNLLTYYQTPEMESSLKKILRVLAPGGSLIIGSHEKLPPGFDYLKSSPDHPWIYFKSHSDSSI